MDSSYNLQDLPVDVILHIFALLDVDNIIAVRKTCRVLMAITRERSVWHQALSTHFLHAGRAVPGISQSNPSELSAEQLEQFTLRACRFWSNWTSAQPKPYRHFEIHPAGRPFSYSGGFRNLAVEFLPGSGGRYLLTLTLHDSASDRDSRRFSFECWDVSGPGPSRVAGLLVSGMTGYVSNSEPDSPHLLAVSRRGPHNTTSTTTYTIDFDTPETEPWFRRTSEFNSYRTTLGLQGSYFLATDTDQDVRIIEVDSGKPVCSFRVPSIHADPTLRFPENQCLDYEFLDGFIITFCKQWIFLYQLPSDTQPADPAPRLDPIAKYKWRWRIDSISVQTRRRPGQHHSPTVHFRRYSGSPAPLQHIDLLVRFDTWYPWPVNILHHFVLPPNPHYAPASFRPADPATFPYLSSSSSSSSSSAAAAGPFVMHSIPSPLRLFTPSDMILGPRGTALWLDASTDQTTPSQAGDHGQRIATKVLAQPWGAPHGDGDRQRPARTQDDQVSPGLVDPELLGATALGGDAVGSGSDSGGGVSVLLMQEKHELWNRVAVNEEEGQVAVGHVDGRVFVYVYAPPE